MEKLSIKHKAFTLLYCSAEDISFEKYVIVKTEQVNSFSSVGCDPFSVPIVLIFSQWPGFPLVLQFFLPKSHN